MFYYLKRTFSLLFMALPGLPFLLLLITNISIYLSIYLPPCLLFPFIELSAIYPSFITLSTYHTFLYIKLSAMYTPSLHYVFWYSIPFCYQVTIYYIHTYIHTYIQNLSIPISYKYSSLIKLSKYSILLLLVIWIQQRFWC